MVSLALALIETLVKNCDRSFHREVATPKFMAQMARIARTYSERTGRENLEVADKVRRRLGVEEGSGRIQVWERTFCGEQCRDGSSCGATDAS